LAKPDLADDFPIAGTVLLAELARGERPTGSGILFL
jgi:hypothetical protein